ncbi:hypothetical protein H4R26_000648 [Coemansia thaxteri]|uniref:Beta-galactosidase n=1 Tax=Coemansia thaxteri TaxID=2663907 RepID=A0A9W8BN65_9FUNG|nr:hypothetical protein H4R26_000648 [Coemansia thaxteri]
MCKELELTKGTGSVVGRVGYLEQSPWIMNDTMRANILFGRELDEEFYWQVVDACALTQDLEMWPNRDMTMIGERGINISGGQRARLALARIVYSRADIYILDDPLSAVDAHVKRHILDNVLLGSGLLGNKLRIVTTHAESMLPFCNQTVTLSDGNATVRQQVPKEHKYTAPIVPLVSASHSVDVAAPEPDNTKSDSDIGNLPTSAVKSSTQYSFKENALYVAKVCGTFTVGGILLTSLMRPISFYILGSYNISALKRNAQTLGYDNTVVLQCLLINIARAITNRLLNSVEAYLGNAVNDRLDQKVRNLAVNGLAHAPMSFFEQTNRHQTGSDCEDGVMAMPSSDDDDDDDDELEIIDGAGANNASSAHRHNARSGWLQRMYMLISGQRELAASGNNCQRRNNGGLDRKIGGRSINRLSSGQRQLFSLCRLLMRKQGKVLVLDEATADIDSESDLKMQQLIRREFRESTVITIAHRLETIMNSDRIVVMDRGEIVEVGQPQELLKRDGGAFAAGGRADKQVPGEPYTVGYSPRGILIDGRPRLLTVGALHYPRSTPEMWDSQMKKAKIGGLNTIDTYVFWNVHEAVKGQYDFATDRANLPLFLETARRNGLFVMLRIGPYVCAEWNYGGFPQWLRHEPGVVFRTFSEPFMREMRRFLEAVVRETRRFLPEHGGPIVAMQIENEYGNLQGSFGRDGERYARWCGATAQALNVSVPWIMCRQDTEVPHVIPTLNDFYAAQLMDKYRREHPQFPGMWTEMWPAWFQRWGEAAASRPIEDTAYAVAAWFARGGTYVSYYMYAGGTNFGRTASPFTQTSYDYDGFLDEYGLENWPKYLHLQALHRVLLANEDLITASPEPQPRRLTSDGRAQAHVYGEGESYVAFLVNTDERRGARVDFGGLALTLHRWSVTVVGRRGADTRAAVLFRTAHPSAAVRRAQAAPSHFRALAAERHPRPHPRPHVRTLAVPPPQSDAMRVRADRPPEHFSVTDDATDYLWHRTTVAHTCAGGGTLELRDAGDVAYAFINGRPLGMRHGREDRLATFVFDVDPLITHANATEITVLTQTMGVAHNELHMEAYARGLLGPVTLCGRDITHGEWLVMPGLAADARAHDAPPPADSPRWKPEPPRHHARRGFRWHEIEIDAGRLLDSAAVANAYAPLAVDLASMTKGQIWINQHHLGRYWLRRAPEARDYAPCRKCGFGGWYWPDNVCRQKCGELSQRYYHLPLSYLNLTTMTNGSHARNFLYLLEEIDGQPENVRFACRVAPSPFAGDHGGGKSHFPSLWWLSVCIAFALAAAGLVVAAVARRGYRHRID